MVGWVVVALVGLAATAQAGEQEEREAKEYAWLDPVPDDAAAFCLMASAEAGRKEWRQ